MDFVKKHRSHISGFQRCIRYWEDKRYRKELKRIKNSGVFNKGGEVDGKLIKRCKRTS